MCISYCLQINSHVLLFSEVRVEGLETLDYLDNLKNRERVTEQGDAITFESEVSTSWMEMLWIVHFRFVQIYISCSFNYLFYLLFYGKGGQNISQYTNKNCYYWPWKEENICIAKRWTSRCWWVESHPHVSLHYLWKLFLEVYEEQNRMEWIDHKGMECNGKEYGCTFSSVFGSL